MPQQAPPTGAQLLIASLLAHGVDTVFGCPGAAVLAIYDELYRHRGQIRHILVSHEQQAAHAADGYARAAGRPAVCIATSGPGATNLLTGIAAAFMDSTPLVIITGNAPTTLLGRDRDLGGKSPPSPDHLLASGQATPLSGGTPPATPPVLRSTESAGQGARLTAVFAPNSRQMVVALFFKNQTYL